jgi:hypothetical protein
MGALSTMSKKRYAEFRARLEARRDMSEVQVEEVMGVLREILDFDPEEKQYTKVMGQRMMAARRAKAVEMGTSVYGMRKRGAESALKDKVV